LALQTAEKLKNQPPKPHNSACIEISANLLQSYFVDKKQAKDDRIRKTWLTAGSGAIAFLTVALLAHLSNEQATRAATLKQEYGKVAAALNAAGLGGQKEKVNHAILALPAEYASANLNALSDLGAVLVSTQAGNIQLTQINLDVSDDGGIKILGTAEVRELEMSRAFTDRIQSLRPDREVMISAVRSPQSGSVTDGLLNLDFIVRAAGKPMITSPKTSQGMGVKP
jgi:hypothetical protein